MSTQAQIKGMTDDELYELSMERGRMNRYTQNALKAQRELCNRNGELSGHRYWRHGSKRYDTANRTSKEI